MLAHRDMGAQILQANTRDGFELFYLSPLSAPPGKPVSVRGGVPVLFPQFAEHGPLPKHGFARTIPWRLQREDISAGSHSVEYTLIIEHGQFANWPHAARLILAAQASALAATVTLEVTNTGSASFSWTGGLHPYFAVADLVSTTITGLAGLPVKDRYDPRLQLEADASPRWESHGFERLYDGCPPLTVTCGATRLELAATGFDEWMVWNPGPLGAEALTDLPADDWRRFVCVEPVRVSRPVLLDTGATFRGVLDVRRCVDSNIGVLT